jgi:hypothetical protein
MAEAEAALERLSRNVPLNVHIGRPLVASPASDRQGDGVQIMADLDGDEVHWFVYSAHVERLEMIGSLAERVSWFGRVESERAVG